MAISEASSTTDTTLDQTTWTNINTMSLTPGAGDYLAIFNATVKFDDPSGGSRFDFRLADAGTGIAHTVRDLFGETSIDGNENMVTCQSEVNLGASDALTAQYQRSSGTNPWQCRQRTLLLFPKDSADLSQASATANDTLNSSTFTQMGSMTLTPGAGTYLLCFSTTVVAGSGTIINVKVFVGGSEVAHTLRTYTVESSIANTEQVVGVFCEVNPGASDAVEIRWAHTGSASTMTAHERTLTLMKVNSADIQEVSSTTDSSSTSTVDELMNSMSLTPGANDYLTLWSGSSFMGTVAQDHTNYYSYYVNGSQDAASERENWHESSVDNADVYSHVVHKVTAAASQAVDVRWRGNDDTSRTIRERTLVLVNEGAAGPSPIDGTTTLTFTTSGDAVGLGAIDGTAALAFTTSADITPSKGSIDGTTTLTFTTSGDAVGLGAMDGTTTLDFTTSGDVQGLAAIDGTTTLTFSLSGTAENALGAIEGTTTLTFTTSGDVVGLGAISGSTTLTFGHLADIIGNALVAGTTFPAFSLSGTIVGKGAIDGTATLGFTTDATARSTVHIDGTAALTFTTSGDVIGLGAIDGTTTLDFTTSGDILGLGSIDGNTDLTFTTDGTVEDAASGPSAIDGTTTLTFSTSGDLDGLGAIDGSTTLSFTVSDVDAAGKTHMFFQPPDDAGTEVPPEIDWYDIHPGGEPIFAGQSKGIYINETQGILILAESETTGEDDDFIKSWNFNSIHTLIKEYNPDSPDNFYDASADHKSNVSLTAKPDGTKLYVTGTSVAASKITVFEYDLSTAWDISSASLGGSFEINTPSGVNPQGSYIRDNGTQWFALDLSTTPPTIREYSMSTAWDITSSSHVASQQLDVTVTSSQTIWFDPSGKRLFVNDRSGTPIGVDQFDLSTAWDITSLAYSKTWTAPGGNVTNIYITAWPSQYMFWIQTRNALKVSERSNLDFTGVLSFTGSGTVTSGLVGTTTLTFTTSGTIVGLGAIDGTATLDFTTSGTAVGKGAISGTTSLTFSTSGDITPSKGSISSAAELSFSLTGDLDGLAAIDGSTALTFTTAGTAVGRGLIEGTTTLDFTTSGQLELVTLQGTATAPLDFSLTGTIVGLGAISGSTSLTFTTDADIDRIIPPAEGTTTLTFSTDATIRSQKIVGTAVLSFVPTASIAAIGHLRATVNVLTFTTPGVSLRDVWAADAAVSNDWTPDAGAVGSWTEETEIASDWQSEASLGPGA